MTIINFGVGLQCLTVSLSFICVNKQYKVLLKSPADTKSVSADFKCYYVLWDSLLIWTRDKIGDLVIKHVK